MTEYSLGPLWDIAQKRFDQTLNSKIDETILSRLDPTAAINRSLANSGFTAPTPPTSDMYLSYDGPGGNPNDNRPGGALPAVARPASESADEWRIRLSALPNSETRVYGAQNPDNVMNILHGTGGMLFPYTPTISFTQNVEYEALKLVHTNSDYLAYSRTPSIDLSLVGDFTIQNYREAQYVLAVVHFLRTCSKMHFGETDYDNAGLPPPTLMLKGYGNYMFNKLRVIMKSHSYTLDKNVDYVNVYAAGGMARLPVLFQITVTLTVQNTPKRWREEFDLEAFRTGRLMTSERGGWL